MGMYTDWGNLQIVSYGAWLNGAGPGSSTVFRWNGRIGGVHFWVNAKLGTVSTEAGIPSKPVPEPRLGEAEKFRYSSICF